MSKFFGWFKKNKNQTEEQVNPTESDVSKLTQPSNDQTSKPAANGEITNNDTPSTEQHASASAREGNKEPASDLILESEQQNRTASSMSETAQTIQTDAAAPDVSELKQSAVQPETTQQEQASIQEKSKQKTSFFSRLKRGLAKTKANIGSGFANLFSGKKIDDDLFEELETQLLLADLGVETTTNIIDKLTESVKRSALKNADTLYPLLKEHMLGLLEPVSKPLQIEPAMPYVILMIGVNGVGKTTTIGKMAKQFQAQGKKVMLAAGDTFRAAAVEQLKVWGERNQIPVVAQATGSDSASVIFDAVQSAKARGVDILIADTAGRLQNKNHLMEELKKIVRVMKKLDPDAPHEIMLTIDASTGQNAISQTALFHEAVGLTGITLTKLDGTAKGGVIFALAEKFQIPIRFIGIGEGIDDLRNFNGQDFVDALFDTKDD